ncbi:hypothetical protein XENOCAPTIV_012177 [Xenoophorus captivus]|uniref:Uncharacterized protein n=1 Tax=Xenoophorus captivus TaxID=1517983 RepID=A0ABV0RC78_9TELE
MLSVSGGLWGSGLDSAGPDAQLLHDDWMICLRLNPFLIDSEMSESAILKLSFPSLKDQHPPLLWRNFTVTLNALEVKIHHVTLLVLSSFYLKTGFVLDWM